MYEVIVVNKVVNRVHYIIVQIVRLLLSWNPFRPFSVLTDVGRSTRVGVSTGGVSNEGERSGGVRSWLVVPTRR